MSQSDLKDCLNNTIPQFNLQDPYNFLERLTAFYGPTGTGKSVILMTALRSLRKFIPNAIVVSPTELQNRTYAGVIPEPFIYYTMSSVETLHLIYARQAMASAVYREANKMEILHGLFDKVATNDDKEKLRDMELAHGRILSDVRSKYKTDKGKLKNQLEDVEHRFKSMFMRIFKKVIKKSLSKLKQTQLNEDEARSIHYIDFNPRLLLIMDDCAAESKKWVKDETITKIFYQGRHNMITPMFVFQDDKDLKPHFRKAVFVSIFTNSNVANTFFSSTSNGFSKQDKKNSEAALPAIFYDESTPNFNKYNKLVYVRDANRQIQYCIGTVRETFRFGSPAYWEYSKQIASNKTSVDKDNPFFEIFHTRNN